MSTDFCTGYYSSYTFDKNQKYTNYYKKSKFTLENKDGKFYIRQKGTEVESSSNELFGRSDYSTYYNIDEKFEFKFLGDEPEKALGLSIFTYDKSLPSKSRI